MSKTKRPRIVIVVKKEKYIASIQAIHDIVTQNGEKDKKKAG